MLNKISIEPRIHTENIVEKNTPIRFTMDQKKWVMVLSLHIERLDFTVPGSENTREQIKNELTVSQISEKTEIIYFK